MSGQFPTSPVANSANIRSLQRTIVSVTTSGRKQARQIDGQRFAITLDFPPMTRAEFAPIKAFVMKQRSQLNNFYSYSTYCIRCTRCGFYCYLN